MRVDFALLHPLGDLSVVRLVTLGCAHSPRELGLYMRFDALLLPLRAARLPLVGSVRQLTGLPPASLRPTARRLHLVPAQTISHDSAVDVSVIASTPANSAGYFVKLNCLKLVVSIM